MNELWKEIPGFPGYEASDCGRVRSHRGHRPGVMKPFNNERGYLVVKLRRGGRYVHMRVNRAVLMAHDRLPQEGQVAAHGDGDKANNRLSNLRWTDRPDNERDKIAHGRTNRGSRNGMSKLTEADVLAIRAARPSSMAACRDLAATYGVSEMGVYNIAAGLRWRHI